MERWSAVKPLAALSADLSQIPRTSGGSQLHGTLVPGDRTPFSGVRGTKHISGTQT